MEKMGYIKRVPLFAELSGADAEKLRSIGKFKAFPKGKTIFNEDASGSHFYIVITGRVKIYATSGAKKKTLAYLEKGEFFGEMALLDTEPRSASSEAIIDSELFVVKKQDFKKLLLKHPNIAFQILRTLSRRLRGADREIEALTFGNVVGRIAATLLDLSKRYGEGTVAGTRIKMSLSHRDIAEIAGTGREMVSRILNRFKRLNCISYANKHVTVSNAEKLRQWAK